MKATAKKGANETKTEIYVFGERHGPTEACVYRAAGLFLNDKDAPLPPILRREHGKPYFDTPGAPYFSVSHSGGLLACAVSECEVGLDVQRDAPPKNRVAERFFHPDEAEYVRNGGNDAFFEVWTAKESYVKYTGRGIDGSFSRFSTVRDGCLAADVGGACLRQIAFGEGYHMCLCTSRPTSVRVIFVEE